MGGTKSIKSGGWENQTPSRNPALEVIILVATFELAQECSAIVHGHSNFAEYIYQQVSRVACAADVFEWETYHVSLTKTCVYHSHVFPTVDDLSISRCYLVIDLVLM